MGMLPLESCGRFFEDSIGYIGWSTKMPQRTICERISAVFALTVFSLASLGIFLFYEACRFCYIHGEDIRSINSDSFLRPIRSIAHSFNPSISYTVEFAEHLKLLDEPDKQEDGDYPQRCTAQLIRVHAAYVNKYGEPSNKNCKIIVPRMDFFDTVDPEKDKDWIVSFICFMGMSTSGRGASNERAYFGTSQLLAYFRQIYKLSEKDSGSIIFAIADRLVKQKVDRNDGISIPVANMFYSLSFVEKELRDESFKKFTRQLFENLPTRWKYKAAIREHVASLEE